MDAVAVEVQVHLAPDTAGQSLLDRIADPKKLKARDSNRILGVARMPSDLDHRDMPSAENVATAIRWRDIASKHAGRRGTNYVIQP